MGTVEKRKNDLETPCLVLDLDILDRNIEKMQFLANRAGKNLRPHAKTHKCSALAKKQIEAGAIGVCVAKVSEAAALINAGINNILLTGPLAALRKIERLADLIATNPSLMVVVDHPTNIAMLDSVCGARRVDLDVLIDVDVGMHRTGIKPAKADSLAKCVVSSRHLHLRGIQAYAGHVQHITSYQTRKQTSLECLHEAVRVFRELHETVPTCTIFASSGTGTFDIDLAIPEITELQAGSYVCMDTEYLRIGSAEDDKRFVNFDPALRLLTTVISNNHQSFVTVDAGLKSLYKDGGKPLVLSGVESALKYDWFGDEYGKISSMDSSELPSLGSVVELITSHCDPTVNLFDRYFLTRGERVIGTWAIDLRGCSQ